MTSDNTHLMTWVSRNVKERFAAWADAQGMSESALLKRLVLTLLPPDKMLADLVANPEPLAPKGRLSIRLRDDDLILLRDRAEARGMPAAIYVSYVVRSHLRRLAPIPDRELHALSHAIAEVSAIGRNLNQIARIANTSGRLEGLSISSLHAILEACTALRSAFKDVVIRNSESWEAGYDTTKR